MIKQVKKVKYPRLILFWLSLIVAIAIFYEWMTSDIVNDFITSMWYFGTFLWGFFYSYGFTSTSATAVLLILSRETNLIIAILVAWLWALISDVLIFLFAKKSLLNEITALKEEKFVIKFRKFLKKTFGLRYKHIMPVVAGTLIMTPLPTEIWITMLASKNNMSMKRFMIVAYLLHTVWIAIILILWHQL